MWSRGSVTWGWSTLIIGRPSWWSCVGLSFMYGLRLLIIIISLPSLERKARPWTDPPRSDRECRQSRGRLNSSDPPATAAQPQETQGRERGPRNSGADHWSGDRDRRLVEPEQAVLPVVGLHARRCLCTGAAPVTEASDDQVAHSERREVGVELGLLEGGEHEVVRTLAVADRVVHPGGDLEDRSQVEGRRDPRPADRVVGQPAVRGGVQGEPEVVQGQPRSAGLAHVEAETDVRPRDPPHRRGGGGG